MEPFHTLGMERFHLGVLLEENEVGWNGSWGQNAKI